MKRKYTGIICMLVTIILIASLTTTGLIPLTGEIGLEKAVNTNSKFSDLSFSDYEIMVNKTVRKFGIDPWVDDVIVNIGETVEFHINVTNTGNFGLTMNRIFDYLPNGLNYIAGSSKLINPDGLIFYKEPTSPTYQQKAPNHLHSQLLLH